MWLRSPSTLVMMVAIASTMAGSASAYRLWMTTDYAGGPLEMGDRITVDVHLDTEGDTGLQYFSVAVVYPPDVIDYVPAESSYNDYYPLYAPAVSPANSTWFVATGPSAPDHPPRWPLTDDQLNVDFIEHSLRPSHSTASDEIMATIVFKPVGFGSGQIELGFDRGGNIFGINQVDVKESIDTGAPIVVNAAAVPSLAPWGFVLLAGVIAFAGRRLIPDTGARAAVAALVLFGAALALPTSETTAFFPLDIDADGVPNEFDNCLATPNGPLATSPSGSCDAQEDADADGYGNPCDADFDNDTVTSLVDLHQVLNVVTMIDPVRDVNCDGAVGIDDLTTTLSGAVEYERAGPSGLACAGTIPCSAP